MRRHVAPAAILLILLAACGGTNSDPSSAGDPGPSTSPAAPAVYTAAQLNAALPGEADLSAGLELNFRCPEKVKDTKKPNPLCPPASETDAFSAGGDVDAASAEGAEQVVNPTNPRDFFAINVQSFSSDAEAEKSFDDGRAAQVAYDGSYDLKPEGAVGVGAFDEVAVGQWTGYSMARTATRAGSPASDQGLLVTSIGVRSGTSLVYAFVSLSAAERDEGAATELADSLLRDYLERLG